MMGIQNVAVESENTRSRGPEGPLNLDLTAVFVSRAGLERLLTFFSCLSSNASMYSMCV